MSGKHLKLTCTRAIARAT